MMKKPSRLETAASRLIVQCASRTSTMLGRAQSMVLSLLNRLDSDGSRQQEEEDTPPPVVSGCHECGAIFEVSCYFFGNEEGKDRCPVCSSHRVEKLGPLPWVIEDEDGHFLMNDEGMVGPYAGEEEAQKHLWTWFNRSNNATEEGNDNQEEDCKVIPLRPKESRKLD